MKIEYESNNSGGIWWLKDEDWSALEKAGWNVKWVKNEAPSGYYKKAPYRHLGALATEASKEFETPGEAMKDFEAITGQKVTDTGCACCGPPHSFSWGKDDKCGFASGEDCLEYLFPDKKIPKDLREAIEEST